MKSFPGKVEMIKEGRVHHLVLNEEQEIWLRTWFPTTENSRLRKAMGISDYKLHCFARDIGLTKSEKGIKAIQRRRGAKAAQTNEKNGCYERKRGHPASAATLKGVARRWQEEKEGKRENVFKRMKRENPKKYKQWQEKLSLQRKESIRKEKQRMLYGLSRKTNLKMLVMTPYKRSQLTHRCSALKRGYFVMEDCSEGTKYRYTIFYDNETQRSEKFEENLVKDGFKVVDWANVKNNKINK